jgi:hypothetical protein
MIKIIALVTFSIAVGAALTLRAQDAAPSTVDLLSRPGQEPSPATVPPPPPDVPELSVLDETFKKSSLGKAADELRQRVEIRRLQNRVNIESAIVNAKSAAEAARTDLEKRNLLRDYYNIYYGRIRSLASSEETRKAIDNERAQHLKLLDQPRVRPSADSTPPPVEKEKKKKKTRHFGHSVTGRATPQKDVLRARDRRMSDRGAAA